MSSTSGRNPKVSVLMSVFNGEPFLRDSIESILVQTFTDFEFIIVDDGSTDASAKIIKSYDDPRIVLISNGENLGLVRSLNLGLDACRGDLIARHDADDMSAETRLAAQVAYLDSHPHIGVLGSQAEVINEKGVCTRNFDVPTNHSMIAWSLLFGCPLAHPSVMLRRQIIQSVGGYSQDYPHVEDLDLWTRLIDKTQFENLQERLILYRDQLRSISHTKHQEQKLRGLEVRRRFAERLLGREIAPVHLVLLRRSYSGERLLSREQVKIVVELLFGLYFAERRNGLIADQDAEDVMHNLAQRIMDVTGGADWTTAKHPRDVRLIESVRRAARQARLGVANPRRAYYKLQQITRKSLHALKDPSQKPESITAESDDRRAIVRDRPGITLIVHSYGQMDRLAALLHTVLKQDLGEIQLELIVSNNASHICLKESRFSKVGRLLSRFPTKRIVNSSYNWRDQGRYALGTLAQHDTIMYADDYILLDDPYFVQYAIETHRKLGPHDIISCSNSIWTEWNEDHVSFVSLNSESETAHDICLTDTVDTGICMLNRHILFSSRIGRMLRDYQQVYDMVFPLVAYLEWGSNSFFLPSGEMLRLQDRQLDHAPASGKDFYDELYSYYKALWKEGYRPVLSREPETLTNAIAAAKRLARELPSVRMEWK